MSKSEKERISITSGEYNAINQIRGLEQNAFYLVVSATPAKNRRFILEGDSEAFDALANDLSDEIHYQLSPPSRLKQLEKLYRRLEPDDYAL